MRNEWRDSPEYLHAVAVALRPREGTRQHALHEFGWTDTARFDHFIDKLLPHTTLSGKRILDSGCGAGGLSVRLLRHDPAEVIGLEVDPVTAPLAKLRVKDEPRIRILTAERDQDTIPDGSIDVIFSLHVIEHVTDRAEYLAGLFRVLRPGGHLLLSCPHRVAPVEAHTGTPLLHYLPRPVARGLGQAAAKLPFWSQYVREGLQTFTEPSHLWFFQVRRDVRRAGFEILQHNDPRALARRFRERHLDRLAALAEALPEWPVRLLAIVASPSINLVCRKPG